MSKSWEVPTSTSTLIQTNFIPFSGYKGATHNKSSIPRVNSTWLRGNNDFTKTLANRKEIYLGHTAEGTSRHNSRNHASDHKEQTPMVGNSMWQSNRRKKESMAQMEL